MWFRYVPIRLFRLALDPVTETSYINALVTDRALYETLASSSPPRCWKQTVPLQYRKHDNVLILLYRRAFSDNSLKLNLENNNGDTMRRRSVTFREFLQNRTKYVFRGKSGKPFVILIEDFLSHISHIVFAIFQIFHIFHGSFFSEAFNKNVSYLPYYFRVIFQSVRLS